MIEIDRKRGERVTLVINGRVVEVVVVKFSPTAVDIGAAAPRDIPVVRDNARRTEPAGQGNGQ